MRRLVSLLAFMTFLPGCVEMLTLSCVQQNPRIHVSFIEICRNKGGWFNEVQKSKWENGEALYSVICKIGDPVEVRIIDLGHPTCDIRENSRITRTEQNPHPRERL